MEEEFLIELFDKKKHNSTYFDCGDTHLNNFMSHYALQQQKKGVNRTFVLVNAHKETLGFYTLSAGSVKHEDAPETLRKRLPHYPIPTVILGRLAVDKRYQRKGIGKKLLKDAMLRVISASDVIGIVSIVVEAKNDAAVKFYKLYGFIPFENSPKKLFLPLKTIQAALGPSVTSMADQKQ